MADRDSPTRWFTRLSECLSSTKSWGCWFEEVQPVCPRVVPVLWKATDVLASVVRGCQLVRLHLSHQIAHNTRVHQGNILCLTRVRVKVEQAWGYVRITGQLIWKIKLFYQSKTSKHQLLLQGEATKTQQLYYYQL